MSYPNNTPESDFKVEKPDVNIFWVSLIVEGSLIFASLILAWFSFYQHDQPLSQLQIWAHWQEALTWGTVATLPPLGFLVVFHFWKPKFFESMRQIVDTKLKPMFRSSSLVELLIISLMAGFCEELFFRWCLQGGIASLLESQFGANTASLIALLLASFAFALCHWVNLSYVIIALIIGVYLGSLMIVTDNWLVPAIAHSLYDFAALIYIAHCRKA